MIVGQEPSEVNVVQRSAQFFLSLCNSPGELPLKPVFPSEWQLRHIKRLAWLLEGGCPGPPI